MTYLVNDLRNLSEQVERLKNLVDTLIKVNEPKPLECDPMWPYGNKQSESRIERFIRIQARRLPSVNRTYADAVDDLKKFKFAPGIDPDLFYIKTKDDQ